MRWLAVFLAAFLCVAAAGAQQMAFQFIGNGVSIDNPNLNGNIVMDDVTGFRLFGTTVPQPPPPTAVWVNDYRTTCVPAGATYTRANATAWEYNASAVLTNYLANVPMCQAYYNAGATNYGFGIWPTRTNQLLNSEVPATQTRTLAAAGTYVATLKGTGSMAITGTGTNLPCTATDGSRCVFTVAASASITFTITGSPTRIQAEFVATGTLTQVAASAPIVTVGSTVTRATETYKGTLSSQGMSSSVGSYLVSFMIPAAANADQTIWSITDGTVARNGYRVWVRTSDQKLQIGCETAGVLGVSAGTGNAISVGTAHTVGFTYDTANGVSISVDGGTTVSAVGACNFTLTTYQPGMAGDASRALQGYFQTAAAYTSVISPSYLATLSAPPQPLLARLMEMVFYAGQSTAVGAYAAAIFTTVPPNPTQSFCPNDSRGCGGMRVDAAYQFYPNSSITGIIPAIEAQALFPPSLPTQFGETGIVQDVAQRISLGSTKGYVSRTVGAAGRTIAQLSVGTAPYGNMITVAGIINALTVINGGTTKVLYIPWIQGYSDMANGTTPASYRSTAAAMSSNAQTRLKAITGQSENPIWLVMQLPSVGVTLNGTGNTIQTAQYDLTLTAGLSNPVWKMCGPSYQFATIPFHLAPDGITQVPDGAHMTVDAYDWQGEQIGQCVMNLAADPTWKPLKPDDIAFAAGDPTTINTTWHVPTSPIQFSTTGLPLGAAFNHGLQFVDDCILAAPATPYTEISNVAITGATTIDVALSNGGWNVACPNPTLKNASDGPALARTEAGQLPIVASPGTGGTPGACVITASFQVGKAQAQATYNATVSGGGALASIDSNVTQGLYPPYGTTTNNGVAVTGCGLTGATMDSFQLRQNNTNLNASGSWSDIADSFATPSRLGNSLLNRALTFSLAVTPP